MKTRSPVGLVFGKSRQRTSWAESLAAFSQPVMKLLFPRTLPLPLPFLLTLLVQTNSHRLTISALPGDFPFQPHSPTHEELVGGGEYLRHPELRELLDVIFCQILKQRHAGRLQPTQEGPWAG